MILYTKTNCPLCTVVRTKLNIAGIEYEECKDEEKMEEFHIDTLPVAQIGDKLLEFKEILNYIDEVNNS